MLIKAVLNSFLPVLTNQYWYFTAYTGVFLCMPILNWIIETVPRSTLKSLFIVFIFMVYLGDRLLTQNTSALASKSGYSFLWLALLYTMGGYMAKYDSLNRLSSGKSFLWFSISIIVTFLMRIAIEVVIYLIKGSAIKNSYESLIVSYVTPTIILAAVFLLNGFQRLRIDDKSSKLIAYFSPLAFGVYLIHTNPIVFAKLYNAFAGLADYNTFLMVLGIIGYALAIYLICTLIELLRKLLFQLLKIKNFSIWIEKTIGTLLKKIAPLIGIETAEETMENQNEKNNEQKEIENENSIFNG